MAGNPVICNNCGRMFDPTAERSVYDQPSHSYICSQCLAQGAPASQGKKPRGKVGSVLRIVFGLLFIMAAFSEDSDGADVTVACIVIGLALLLWQFWPQLKGLFVKKRETAAARRQAEARQVREAQKKKVCPHCGAPTTGLTCEYCGMAVEGK